MGRTRRSPVKTSIRRTLLAALLSVVVTALALHECLRRRDLARARDAAAVMLARALATQCRADVPQSRQDMQRACERWVEHAAVLAVCVWDQSGAPVACAAVADEWLPLVGSDRRETAVDGTIKSAELPPNVDYSEVRRVDVDLGVHLRSDRPARMAMLLAWTADRRDSAAHIWFFVLPLLGVGAGAFVLGLRQLRRHVVRPITLLAEAAAATLEPPGAVTQPERAAGFSPRGAAIADDLPLQRGAAGFSPRGAATAELSQHCVRSDGRASTACPSGDDALGAARRIVEDEDDLEVLAGSLRDLQRDVDMWRRHAKLVERRMDAQIAVQTRKIARDMNRMQREVWRDMLTGLNNRRVLDEKFPEIFAAQRDARQDLSVVMLDLDHFKTLNDSLGHGAGDEVLTFVGELLGHGLRAEDIAVRYGGDEFVLILPGLSVDKAQTTAYRLMALFAQRAKMMAQVQPAPTMSAGIASLWNNWPASHIDLLKLADRALYDAKQAGRAEARIYRNAHKTAR